WCLFLLLWAVLLLSAVLPCRTVRLRLLFLLVLLVLSWWLLLLLRPLVLLALLARLWRWLLRMILWLLRMIRWLFLALWPAILLVLLRGCLLLSGRLVPGLWLLFRAVAIG